jgi:phospholipase/carboxylesterase
VIVLPGQKGHVEDLIAFARALGADVSLYVAEAPRVLYYGRASVSRYWFIGEPGRPDPATFGDTLYQVEQFVYDVADRTGGEGTRPFLLGYEQGAVLALAATEVIPERLVGVVALGGYVPEIEGWEPPARELDGLPILLVDDTSDETIPAGLLERTRERLTREGASVEALAIAEGSTLGPRIEDAVEEWLRKATR